VTATRVWRILALMIGDNIADMWQGCPCCMRVVYLP
jgi:hypothetical protein